MFLETGAEPFVLVHQSRGSIRSALPQRAPRKALGCDIPLAGPSIPLTARRFTLVTSDALASAGAAIAVTLPSTGLATPHDLLPGPPPDRSPEIHLWPA